MNPLIPHLLQVLQVVRVERGNVRLQCSLHQGARGLQGHLQLALSLLEAGPDGFIELHFSGRGRLVASSGIRLQKSLREIVHLLLLAARKQLLFVLLFELCHLLDGHLVEHLDAGW